MYSCLKHLEKFMYYKFGMRLPASTAHQMVLDGKKHGKQAKNSELEYAKNDLITIQLSTIRSQYKYETKK